MSAEDLALLSPHLERVPLACGDVLVAAGDPIETLCFPEGAITSVADVLADGTFLEIGLIGHEGLAGWPALLGCAQAPHEAVVRAGEGFALRIEIEPMLDAYRASDTLQALLLRFVQAFTIQMGRTIVSNLIDPVERRLSRWLLMYHDRIAGNEMHITHDHIATMLGVRRASVTDMLHILEGEGAIRSRRGCVTMRDRAALERLAGESYGFAEAHYRRLIAPFGREAKPARPSTSDYAVA